MFTRRLASEYQVVDDVIAAAVLQQHAGHLLTTTVDTDERQRSIARHQLQLAGVTQQTTRVQLTDGQTGHGLTQLAATPLISVHDGVLEADVAIQLEHVELVVAGGTLGLQQLTAGVGRVTGRQAAFLSTVGYY